MERLRPRVDPRWCQSQVVVGLGYPALCQSASRTGGKDGVPGLAASCPWALSPPGCPRAWHLFPSLGLCFPICERERAALGLVDSSPSKVSASLMTISYQQVRLLSLGIGTFKIKLSGLDFHMSLAFQVLKGKAIYYTSDPCPQFVYSDEFCHRHLQKGKP